MDIDLYDEYYSQLLQGDTAVREEKQNGEDGGVSYHSSGGYNQAESAVLVGSGKHRIYISSGVNGNQKKKNIARELEEILSPHSIKIPGIAKKNTVNLYCSGIQQVQIKRGGVKRGCLAACLYHILQVYKMPRKPKEIKDIFNIEQRDLSNGISILNSLYARKSISYDVMYPPISIVDINGIDDMKCYHEAGLMKKDKFVNLFKLDCTKAHDFLHRYFLLLDIPINHLFDFANMLVYYMMKFKVMETSIVSSKCVGAIYFIIKAENMKVNDLSIERYCDISKGTYKKIYDNLLNIAAPISPEYRRLRGMLIWLVKKYGVVMSPHIMATIKAVKEKKGNKAN